MLKKPIHGWSQISIGDWSDRCSYLDDVPFDLLNVMIASCKNHCPVSVKFDAEGYEYIIVIDWHTSYIIYQDATVITLLPDAEKSKPYFVHADVNRDDLAKELISDIRESVGEWASFYCSVDGRDDHYEEAVKTRTTDLLALCNTLEHLLPSDDYRIICSKDTKEPEDP